MLNPTNCLQDFEYIRTGSDPTEGLPTTITSYRSETIQTILHKLQNEIRLVHSSPPMSGKSAICSLLGMAFKSKHPNNTVVKLNCSGVEVSGFKSFKEDFTKNTKHDWENIVRNRSCLLILDDAHLFYHMEACFQIVYD